QVSAVATPLARDKKRAPIPVIARQRPLFVFGAVAARGQARPEKRGRETANLGAAPQRGPMHSGKNGGVSAGAAASEPDLTDIFKALVRLARENGQLTYDDINELVPDGVSADALDGLCLRLNSSGIQIAVRAEVETPKSEELEVAKDGQYDAFADPVQAYMTQVGRVPLLKREEELEIFRLIEEACFETKRLAYGLGFAAKEHIAIAEKLLAEPPKERFDRIVVEIKGASRDRHLRQLRRLVKQVGEL